MTGGADPVLRVQRRILDQAGHENVTVAESVEWVTITDPPPAVVPVGRSLWQRITRRHR